MCDKIIVINQFLGKIMTEYESSYQDGKNDFKNGVIDNSRYINDEGYFEGYQDMKNKSK